MSLRFDQSRADVADDVCTDPGANADDEAPSALCLSSPASRVVATELGAAAVFAVPPTADPWCVGNAFDAPATNLADGWACVAAVAPDALGNLGLSPPLRICIDHDDNGLDGAGAPPAPMADPATGDPRLPARRSNRLPGRSASITLRPRRDAMRASRMVVALVALLASVFSAPGCKKESARDKEQSPSQDPSQAKGEAKGEEQREGKSEAQSQVLRLWHYEAPNSAMGVAWKEAIARFEKSHPGVTVKFEEKGFEQIQQNAGMILNSDEAPDIMEYNKGNATAGLLSSQGLLTDLTEEAGKRGWDKTLSASLQTTARYDGGVMGGDKWYGIPNYGEFVMVYYNKDLFAKHGVNVPTSLAELEAAMDKFAKAGVPPLSVGGAEYPAQQIFYLLVLSKADRKFVDAFELYKGQVDFHGPELTFGAERFAQWVAKGYIPKNSAGIKAEDMGIAFAQGKFPMLISGSWWYGRFASDIKSFQWGSFPFPGNRLHPGSSGNLWVVPARSRNKQLAYDFIDETMKPDIQNLLGNSGGVPVAADPTKITDAKNKELIASFNSIAGSDGLAFYPDWPAPGYYDVLVAAVQELINGSKKPAQMLDDIARPYNEHRASIGK